jgi:hypothetical protein
MKQFFVSLVDEAGKPDLQVVDALGFFDAYSSIPQKFPDREVLGIFETGEAFDLAGLLVQKSLDAAAGQPLTVGES